MSYVELVKQHGRFIGFGLTLTFLSSFGQTFFVALFNDSLREEFGLTHTQIGSYYSLATLASALSIAWLGRMVDTIDLRVFTSVVCGALSLAAFGMASVPSATLLIGVFFVLRLTGQGLLSHTALTSMSRYFEETRGKAMSLAGLGYPLGEAVLPVLAVALMGAVGWRNVWAGIGVFMALIALPLALVLLRGHTARHALHLEVVDRAALHGSGSGAARGQSQWTLHEVLRDVRFALLLPVVVSPGFIVTGFFFHQNHLVETKGWSVGWFATCFAIYAAGQVASGIAAGPLVDRYSGKRLLSVFALPMAAGLTALALSDAVAVAAVFMLGSGITAGLNPTVVGSMWAELYGARHLGAIRAMGTSIMVLGTAASPALMGALIDGGLSMEAMAWGAVGYVLLATTAVTVAMRLPASR